MPTQQPPETTPNFPARLRQPVSRRTESGKVAALVVIAILAVLLGVLAIAATLSSSGGGSQHDERGWDSCLAEERARIAEEGSLLTAEDFCSIRYPGHAAGNEGDDDEVHRLR